VPTSASKPAVAVASKPVAQTPASPATKLSPATVARLYQGLPWSYCGPARGRHGRGVAASQRVVLPPAPSKDELVNLTADNATYDQTTELLTLYGNVQADRGTEEVIADKMTYNHNTGDIVATGDAYLAHPGVRAVGTQARMNLNTDQGTLVNAHYRVVGPINARGTAQQADLLSRTLTKYTDATYTTCRPGQEDWSLHASKLDLDQAEGLGVAHGATLRVLDVPVFYTPYLQFPIDNRRRSGFLVPSIGSSNNGGFELSIPYYWNIAPNMDATVVPSYMAKRGPMLGTEFRYLNRFERVTINAEGMPEDNAYSTSSPRGAFHVDQTGQFGPHWSSSVDFNYVSDDTYLQDFGAQLEVTSVRNLERRGDLTYSGNGWSILSRFQDFQTVDPTLPAADRPYARLPELLLTVSPYHTPYGITAGLNAEYDDFYQPSTVYGQRLALHPYVSWTLQRPYGYIKPTARLYETLYSLQNQQPGEPSSFSHTIPSIDVDGRLVFERNINWLGSPAIQTLEPRLYYLLTPYVNQNDAPLFDTTEMTFSFDSLFRPNRFTGSDRIADANQLTVGLTSRTLSSESGNEIFSASVGQIFYFQSQDVQLSGPPQTNSSSPLAGEVAAHFLPHWSGRAAFEWNPDTSTDQWEKRSVELHYETPDHRLVNLAYRFDLGTATTTAYDNTDFTFQWPVTPQLEVVGRWLYSWLYHDTQEAFAGLEYGKCCWRIRLLGRHIQTRTSASGSTSVMLEVELAGLGNLGSNIEKYLKSSIYGYHAD
jgi:LPS-assembly protein